MHNSIIQTKISSADLVLLVGVTFGSDVLAEIEGGPKCIREMFQSPA